MQTHLHLIDQMCRDPGLCQCSNVAHRKRCVVREERVHHNVMLRYS